MLLNLYKNKKKKWMDETIFPLSTVKDFFVHHRDSGHWRISGLTKVHCKDFLYIIQILYVGAFRGEQNYIEPRTHEPGGFFAD